MNLKNNKFLYCAFFSGISVLLVSKTAQATPSSYFEERKECIENPDFITPNTKEFKYCLKDNGIIKKYDEFDNLIEIDLKLDQLVQEKVKKELKKKVTKKKANRNSLRALTEYKIDDEELFEY